MAQCQLFAILFIFNNKSINNLVSNIKVIEKVVFTDVFYKDMIFTKENVKYPLFFKTFKIENENLKLQKEMKKFWWLENNAYLCKKLEKSSNYTSSHDR